MFSSFFAKNKKNEKLVLLIDVGSASVGAALVEINGSTAPRIYASSREDIALQEKLAPAQLMRAMNQALEGALKSVQSSTKTTGIPAHIFCSLSSPWFLSKNKNLVVERKESFEVTPATLEKFLDEEISRIQDELKDTLPQQDVRIIEKKIIRTKLNGYEINNPYGQRASRVELALTVGISSKQATERIEHTISNFFHSKIVHFGAFPIAAFNIIRDIFPTERTFLFLDITGEGTDISLVSNNVLADTVVFPRGKNFFIREISSQFRIPHQVATSVLNMFLGGTLDDNRKRDIELFISKIENDWITRFEKAVTLLNIMEFAPHKIFFMADSDVSVLFERMLRRIPRTMGGQEYFEVQRLDSLTVGKFASFESGVARDPFLVAEALLAAKVVPQLKK